MELRLEKHIQRKILKKVDCDKNSAKTKLNKILTAFLFKSLPIGTIGCIKHNIYIEKLKPLPHKRYSVPTKIRENVKKELKRLIYLDIIQPPNANFSSPVFTIEKKRDIRFIGDFRDINSQTRDDNLEFPSINDILGDLKKANTFSVIYLNSEYHQLHWTKKPNHLPHLTS